MATVSHEVFRNFSQLTMADLLMVKAVADNSR